MMWVIFGFFRFFAIFGHFCPFSGEGGHRLERCLAGDGTYKGGHLDFGVFYMKVDCLRGGGGFSYQGGVICTLNRVNIAATSSSEAKCCGNEIISPASII